MHGQQTPNLLDEAISETLENVYLRAVELARADGIELSEIDKGTRRWPFYAAAEAVALAIVTGQYTDRAEAALETLKALVLVEDLLESPPAGSPRDTLNLLLIRMFHLGRHAGLMAASAAEVFLEAGARAAHAERAGQNMADHNAWRDWWHTHYSAVAEPLRASYSNKLTAWDAAVAEKLLALRTSPDQFKPDAKAVGNLRRKLARETGKKKPRKNNRVLSAS